MDMVFSDNWHTRIYNYPYVVRICIRIHKSPKKTVPGHGYGYTYYLWEKCFLASLIYIYIYISLYISRLLHARCFIDADDIHRDAIRNNSSVNGGLTGQYFSSAGTVVHLSYISTSNIAVYLYNFSIL